MNKSTVHATSALLYLSAPSGRLDTWYSASFAGLPLLVRSVLTLQRSGIRDILIYGDCAEQAMAPLRGLIEKDPRVDANVRWAAGFTDLLPALAQAGVPAFIINGSAVHDKKLLRQAFMQTRGNQAAPHALSADDEKNLQDFFRQLDTGEPGVSPPDLFVYIPASAGAALQKPEDFGRQHERLLRGSGQPHDSPITRILSRPVSRAMTRLFLATPITPNQITIFSFLLGLAAAFCFLEGSRAMNIAGGVLLVFSTWVDGVDGEIARLKFQETEIGGKLDIYCDNIIHFLVFAALGAGVYQQTGEAVYLALGFLAALGSLASFLLLSPFLLVKRSFNPQTAEKAEAGKAMAEKFANRDFIHFILILALAGLLPLFTWIAAIGSSLFTAYLLYHRFSNR